MIDKITSLREELGKLIQAALSQPYESISTEGIKTGNHYQSVRLGDKETAGFRLSPVALLDNINLRDKKVLDLGSNLGEISRAIRTRGSALVDGFETDAYFLQLSNLINVYNATTGVTYYQHDIRDPSSYQEHYDIVFALSVFEHIRDTIKSIADITDECLILETYKLENNLYFTYIEPLLQYFPYYMVLGYLPWSAADQKARRAWVVFAKDQVMLEKVVQSQAELPAPQTVAPDLEEQLREVIGLSIPHHGVISMVEQNSEGVRTFNRVQAIQFAEAQEHDIFNHFETITARIHDIQQKNAEYLLIPATEFWLFAHYPELKTYLAMHYRCIAQRNNVCLIYALHKLELADPQDHMGPDGLSLPPPEFRALVTPFYDADIFLASGLIGAEGIIELLKKYNLDINDFGSILDFGCGCGRIMRYWKDLQGPNLFGTDYNPYLISWCQKSLPFAAFNINQLADHLDYQSETFDFVYTISIFTHLEERLQHFWIDELRRILKPGGYLLLTVHGETRLHELTPEQLSLYQSGKVVVVYPEQSGRNTCATYHPEIYVREILIRGFELIAFVPGGAQDLDQDIYLLQKPDLI